MSVQFRILGPVEIDVAGDLVALPRRRDRCLLAVLLLEANQPVSIGELTELLWDGEPPDGARRSIHGQVSRLRATLRNACGSTAVALTTVGESYRLEVAPQAVDLHRFRSLLNDASTTNDLAERIELLRTALDLWRGPALGNAATKWLRDRLCIGIEEQRLTAIEDLFTAGLTLGREREVLPELARAVTAHPGRENLAALHLRALYQAGRKAEALEAYERSRRYLADELGIDPGTRLRETHQAILRDQLGQTEPATPTTASGQLRTDRTPVVPRQLPADIATFTGREAELDKLDSVQVRADRSSTMAIMTICGTAGVGKTALAVHWAHRVRDQFPDGQLYVNLRGFDPAASPVPPAQAVRAFLDALAVPPGQVPANLDAQVGLFRSLVASQQVLVLLDNARDCEQVRPLLPGASGCLVLVTSRDQLTGLVAADGAVPIQLDLLRPDQAHRLLAQRLAGERLSAEPVAARRLVAASAGLPLALSIVAARAAIREGFPLADLAGELSAAGAGLDAWSGPDGATDVRNVFSWSYRGLSQAAARLFRLLSLHPGQDLDVAAAASLAGSPLRRTRQLLAELTEASLLAEPRPGRYSCHDLLRAYAGELTHELDAEVDRLAAQHRTVDHYLRTAHAAQQLLDRHRQTAPLPTPPLPDVVPAPLEHSEAAIGWLATELPALLHIIDQASAAGLDTHARHLAGCLITFFIRNGYPHHLLTTQRAALHCAQRLADRAGEASAHSGLANAYTGLGDFGAARAHFQRTLDLWRELADLERLAYSLLDLAWLAEQEGRYEEALASSREAYHLLQERADPAGQARALNMVGWSSALLGNYREALAMCQQALAIQREVEDHFGAGPTCDSLGYVHDQMGDHQQAITWYRQALELYDRHEYRHGRAQTLSRLGDTYRATGAYRAARAAWQEAMEIFEQLGVPDADIVRARLADLPAGAPRR